RPVGCATAASVPRQATRQPISGRVCRASVERASGCLREAHLWTSEGALACCSATGCSGGCWETENAVKLTESHRKAPPGSSPRQALTRVGARSDGTASRPFTPRTWVRIPPGTSRKAASFLHLLH